MERAAGSVLPPDYVPSLPIARDRRRPITINDAAFLAGSVVLLGMLFFTTVSATYTWHFAVLATALIVLSVGLYRGRQNYAGRGHRHHQSE